MAEGEPSEIINRFPPKEVLDEEQNFFDQAPFPEIMDVLPVGFFEPNSKVVADDLPERREKEKSQVADLPFPHGFPRFVLSLVKDFDKSPPPAIQNADRIKYLRGEVSSRYLLTKEIRPVINSAREVMSRYPHLVDYLDKFRSEFNDNNGQFDKYGRPNPNSKWRSQGTETFAQYQANRLRGEQAEKLKGLAEVLPDGFSQPKDVVEATSTGRGGPVQLYRLKKSEAI